TVAASAAHLFKPRDQYRLATENYFGGGAPRPARAVTPENAAVHPQGEQPPSGAVVQYWLATPSHQVRLEFADSAGKIVRSFSSRVDSAHAPGDTAAAAAARRRGGTDPVASTNAGVNTFVWNMRYADATSFPGMILWAAGPTGPMVAPGFYRVKLYVDGTPVNTQSFRILPDPRIKATIADWQEQARLSLQILDRFSAANQGVKETQHLTSELTDRGGKIPA